VYFRSYECVEEFFYGLYDDPDYDPDQISEVHILASVTTIPEIFAKYHFDNQCVSFVDNEKYLAFSREDIHVYDNIEDKSCNNCGHTHVYDNTCDATCNTCGCGRYITHSYKSTWDSDASQHWHECTVCGDKKEKHEDAQHSFDSFCDTTCNICGHIRTNITHSYQTTWRSDSSQHWHECYLCGTPDEKVKHQFGNAMDENCDICGYTRQVQTTPSATTPPPATTPSTTTPSTTPDETTSGGQTTEPPVITPGTTSGSDSNSSNGSDSTTLIIVIVAVGVGMLALGLGFGLGIGLAKGKKK
jgi:hypothetical protein